jgi:hypothetical protein
VKIDVFVPGTWVDSSLHKLTDSGRSQKLRCNPDEAVLDPIIGAQREPCQVHSHNHARQTGVSDNVIFDLCVFTAPFIFEMVVKLELDAGR